MSTAINMAAAQRVMVALDVKHMHEAMALSAKFEGIPCWMKVGMELFYAAGPALAEQLKANGHRVFLDLKLHDIPNTVRGAARSVTRLGVDMFNVHAAGGSAMMRAAMEGAREEAEAMGPSAESRFGPLGRPVLIGVTQLTSTSERILNEEIGIPGTIDEAVLRYAELTKRAGLDGVVASARESAMLKQACGEAFVLVTPGIRPKGVDAMDQARVMTPAEAIAAGSDYLVIGRAITGAADPRQALLTILEEMNAAL